jgi:hypothetical protein
MSELIRLAVGSLRIAGLSLMFSGQVQGQSAPASGSTPTHAAPNSIIQTPEVGTEEQCLEPEPQSEASKQSKVKVKFPTLPQGGGGETSKLADEATKAPPPEGHSLHCCGSVDRQLGKPKYDDIKVATPKTSSVEDPCGLAATPANQTCQPSESDAHATPPAPGPVPMPYPHPSGQAVDNGGAPYSADPMLCKKRKSVTFQGKKDQDILGH